MEEIDTEPLSIVSIPLDLPVAENPPSYGQLVGGSSLFGTIELCSEIFKFGRDPRCNLVIDQTHFPPSLRSFISNVHFILQKDLKDHCSPTYIIDNSMNGTSVNGTLIGKNNRIILMHGDIISIASFANLFVYYQHSYTVPKEIVTESLKQSYHIGKTLGSGSFGTVYLLHAIATCKPYALKVVKKTRVVAQMNNTSCLDNEVYIMKKLNHPCIIKMFEFIEEPGSICMVIEYMQGGDLLTRILDNHHLSEHIAKFFFYQLCEAIRYLHDKGIIHRDLKPDNILLKDSNIYTLLKVSDFGSSKFLGNNVLMRTICGTPEYVAPEVLEHGNQKPYTRQIDIWSLGVVLYTMLSGLLPFAKSDGITDIEQIKRGQFTLSYPVFRSVNSCRVKKLIYDILNVDPKKRPTITMLVQSEWFRDSNEVQQAKCMMNEFKNVSVSI
ncbi:ovarian-specific serine/threonine-protein kinase Lok-like [Anopheles maculipalpis]|uniref:ovarian-specific serine/threonine-protein kinase Lok-like n=1 Tax=Anopheles maculipalpis TaxID=1496333 RepID=UPI00215947F7|nr:ovarian-specific serine/threonine-protein kinase Lok-like [Anopheles maculipalpis]